MTFTKESDFEDALVELLSHKGWEKNVITYSTEDELKDSVDKFKAKKFFEERDAQSIPPFKVNMKTDDLLKRFMFSGGFEISPLEL